MTLTPTESVPGGSLASRYGTLPLLPTGPGTLATVCHAPPGSSIATLVAVTEPPLAAGPEPARVAVAEPALAARAMLTCESGRARAQVQTKRASPAVAGAEYAVAPASPWPLGASSTRTAGELGAVPAVRSDSPGCELPGPSSSNTEVSSCSLESRRTEPMAFAVDGADATRNKQGLSTTPGMLKSPTIKNLASSAPSAPFTLATVQFPTCWAANGPYGVVSVNAVHAVR